MRGEHDRSGLPEQIDRARISGMERTYGSLTGSAVGVLMREAVTRAIREIQKRRFIFEATVKDNELKPEKEDFVTDADKAAQTMYVKLLKECFPGFGIVAEEDHLSIPCTIPEHNFYFTVDPLDGTKAFIRGQSHGVGTMLALVCDGVVVSAWIGDVFSNEIYGYRPDSPKTHRITDVGPRALAIDPKRPLKEQHALIRERPRDHSLFVSRLLGEVDKCGGTDGILIPGIVKNFEITGGSIGTSIARLWKDEVGMAILMPGHHTPWDLTPVYGISKHLGFEFFEIDSRGMGKIRPWSYEPTTHPIKVEAELIIVHGSRVQELMEFDIEFVGLGLL